MRWCVCALQIWNLPPPALGRSKKGPRSLLYHWFQVEQPNVLMVGGAGHVDRIMGRNVMCEDADPGMVGQPFAMSKALLPG